MKRKMSTDDGKQTMPLYVFNTRGEVIVHLQVTVNAFKCSCSRITTPYFPDGWKHQWSLECVKVIRSTTTSFEGLEARIRRAPENQSQCRIHFWLKIKEQSRSIDFPDYDVSQWGNYGIEDVVGEVIDVTIRVPLDGDFAYLSKKRRNHSFARSFKPLVSKEFETDVTITANDGKSASAHWNVLCSRSSVFSSMCIRDFKESKTNEIKIALDFETLELFLTFIYIGQTDFGSVENGKALLAAGDMYLIEDMKSAAEEFLCESLDTENAADLVAVGDKYNAPALRQRALNILRRKTPL